MEKKRNRKIVMAKKLTNWPDAYLFDRRFWKKAGPQARFAATWSAVDEFYKIRGLSGYKLRLRRSVQNIKQA